MKSYPFPEVVTDVTAKFTKIKASDYQEQGQYKIIDQGKEAVAGYTDDVSLVNGQLLPVVVFGDHTRALKYVDEPIALGADGAKVLWVNSDLASARYVYYYLRSIHIKEAGYSRHFKFLKEIEIPIPFKDGAPDFDCQIRIAHLLGKVEGLIAQRKQHLQQLDDLLKSVFLEMFGDPVRNEKGWDTLPFSHVGKFTSGGTPSKSRDDFWVGAYPWVSPKDMKVPKIFDSEDHIAAKVFDETSLKRIAPGHLLIVVRGMILAHSFPVAINMVDVAINQDMKAIKLKSGLRNTYVFYCLISLKRQILKLITTAGHGTKKFDSDVMAKLLIPVPPLEMQEKFLLIADKIEHTQSNYLYGALSQKAFKGELDLSRVPMPDEHGHNDGQQQRAVHTPDAIGMTTPKVVFNHLMQTGSPEERGELLARWLRQYLANTSPDVTLGSAQFLESAWQTLQDARLETNREAPAITLDDYDILKDLVFKALASGTLTQAFDEAGNRVELKALRA
jgi:type I restriction enzyme, S subunit